MSLVVFFKKVRGSMKDRICLFCRYSAADPDPCHDEQGKVFYCCGWCWAHVLGGGFVPKDIEALVARVWYLRDHAQVEIKEYGTYEELIGEERE